MRRFLRLTAPVLCIALLSVPTYALYLRPGSTFDLHHRMLLLPAGTASEPPPFVSAVPPPPPGSFHQPGTAPPVAVPPAPQPAGVAQASAFGTLDLRVQPPSEQLTVDGQPWLISDEGHFVVQVPAGSHHVEVSKDGYRRFAIDLAVRDAERAPLNVSLMPGTP